MYKVTQRRLEAAKEILEKHRSRLHTSGRLDCTFLEKELRDCWGTGFQTLKDLIVDLSKNDRYKFVAAYYMQNQNPNGPVSEFQPRLAQLYGVQSYIYAKDLDEKRKAFWSRLQSSDDADGDEDDEEI